MDDIEKPYLDSYLQSYLQVRREEYEAQYGPLDEIQLSDGLDLMENHAPSLITTAVVSKELRSALEKIDSSKTAESHVRELLKYRIVHHRLEFDLAADVIARLSDVEERIAWVSVLNIIMLGYSPSPTATKYFERATTLYLAGYPEQSLIMCGAVLESAMRDRYPNELLDQAGIRPTYKKAQDYSIGQRMAYEEDMAPLFTEERRALLRKTVDARNYAMHVQVDVSVDAQESLLNVAMLLPVIFPASKS